ncbi:MAG: hypothetical protein M0Z80_09000 [Treponema sp.]|nr:hypothetical protein [Treponema sp.]
MSGSTMLHIALSFIIAGTWISFATMAGERLGSRIGGLFTNLPSNILISLLFMALTRGRLYAAQASGSVPVGMVVDTIFLFTLIAFLPFGTWIGLSAALAAWIAAAALAILLPPLSLGAGILVYALVCALALAIIELVLRVRAVPRKSAPFRPSTAAVRALFAGTIVASAVLVAQYAPPYATGILATFPAVLLSTMVILIGSQGRDFARATGKVLILSSSNIIVYAVAVWFLFPALGAWWGTLLSFILAALYVSLLLPFARRLS